MNRRLTGHWRILPTITRPQLSLPGYVKPKDKALVENQVKLVYTRVYARLRNQQFFDLHSLNKAIKEKIRTAQPDPDATKALLPGRSFLADEKHLLQPLPGQPLR